MRFPRFSQVVVAMLGFAVVVPAGHLTEHAVFLFSRSVPQEREQESTPLELLHAGSMEVRTITPRAGEPYRVTDAADSVLFRHGDQYILADNATYLDLQEQIVLSGRVHGWDLDWTFWADEVIYRGQERIITTRGNVRSLNLRDSTRVDADQIRFDRNSGDGLANGFPRLFQPPKDSTANATIVEGSETSRLFFHKDAGWAEIDRGAVVRRGDITISGSWLRSEDNPQRLIVRNQVELIKEGIHASGGQLVWDESNGLARLTGDNPRLNRWASREEGSLDSVRTSMVADSLDLLIEEDVLQSIHMHGQGEVTTVTIPEPGSVRIRPDSTEVPAEPDHMRLIGRDIDISLEGERLDVLTAQRGAMYYWREDLPERTSALGGMELVITFISGEPENVEARQNAVTRYFTDLEAGDSDMVRMLASLIRFTLEDGAFKRANLENGNAVMYSADIVRSGVVSMAVHPDSVRVGAVRGGGGGSSSVPPAG
ncbi:hypothetical protein ACFL6T_03710 [Candidatus Zixiibacteriota bacterium]